MYRTLHMLKRAYVKSQNPNNKIGYKKLKQMAFRSSNMRIDFNGNC